MEQRKITLEESWTLTLEMWRWIVSEFRRSSEFFAGFLYKDENSFKEYIWTLKHRWLKENREKYWEIVPHPLGSCFFCEYAEQKTNRTTETITRCINCPGRLVHNDFWCSSTEYQYDFRPENFLTVLEALNILRLPSKDKQGCR